MSTICLDMLLGSHTLTWAVRVIFIGSNPSYGRWTESNSFLSTGTPDTALFSIRCLPRQSPVGFVCPVAHRTVRCD
jgi:hypothetical protein